MRGSNTISWKIHDQVFLNTILICTRVDVTDAKAIEKATQDAVKDFGGINGWHDTSEYSVRAMSNVGSKHHLRWHCRASSVS